MRHGYTRDYNNLSYEEFIRLLTKGDDIPLNEMPPPVFNPNGLFSNFSLIIKLFAYNKNKRNSYLEKYCIKRHLLPEGIDVIYHSLSRRSIQTARKIRDSKSNKIIVDSSLAHLLAEVRFDQEIVSEEEFNKFGGFNDKCRKLILKKWFDGQNKKEQIPESIERVRELDRALRQIPKQTIVLITHGWLLRIIYLYYKKKITNCDSMSISDLQNAPIYDFGNGFKCALIVDDAKD
jgi:broad specificity phosphatase PhoE